MSAIESVKQTLVAIANLTDDMDVREMVDFCIDNIDGIRKEQDRDTRHACASAVNRIALDHETIMKAHSTIMNTKAI